jgi:DNA primase
MAAQARTEGGQIAMRIPEETIDAIRAATNIVEVIGQHLPLTAAGRNYKGLCPFHEEKTPSFIVSPERQTYHCFGCGVGGNVFSFLMKNQGLEFLEALELLASRAGILLPRRFERRGAAGDPRGPGRLLTVLEEVTRFYERNLWESREGTRARAYLEERAIREETAREARLGYALPGFDRLRGRFGESFGVKTLIASGLLVEKGEDRNYDRFRDRLMFPIFGPGNRPIGFGARSLDGSEPKYLNSPETAVYHKREVLYGLETARSTLARRGTAWLVEGYMDVLSLRQAGFDGVLAVSGTALSERHARLLGRHARQVLLLFDGDKAGQLAVMRSLPPLLGEGLAVQVALIPEGDDPDSLARQGGSEAVKGVAEKADSVVNFVVTFCYKTHSKEMARVEALRQLSQLGSLVPDGLGRRLFAEAAARRLGFDETTLARDIEAGARRESRMAGGSWRGQAPSGAARRPEAPRRGSEEPGAGSHGPVIGRRAGGQRAERLTGGAERMLLTLALGDASVVKQIRQELSVEDFTNPLHRQLVELLLAREERGESIRAADLVGPDSDEAMTGLVSQLAVDPAAPEKSGGVLGELIARMRTRRRRAEIVRLRELIREHEAAGRRDEIAPLLERVQSLIQSG